MPLLAGVLVMLGVVTMFVAATALDMLDVGFFLPSAQRRLASLGRKGVVLLMIGAALIVGGISLLHVHQ